MLSEFYHLTLRQVDAAVNSRSNFPRLRMHEALGAILERQLWAPILIVRFWPGVASLPFRVKVRSQPLGDLQGRRSGVQRLLLFVSRSHFWASSQKHS